MKFGKCVGEAVPVKLKVAQFDVTLIVALHPTGELHVELQYNTSLFKETTIRNMSLHMQTLLTALSDDPTLKLSEYNILPAAEREQLLREWNDTDMDFPETKTIPELFESQAAKTPTNLALQDSESEYNYTQLDKCTTQPVLS